MQKTVFSRFLNFMQEYCLEILSFSVKVVSIFLNFYLFYVHHSCFLSIQTSNPYISCHWWYKLSDIVFKYKFFDIVLEFHNYDFNFIYSVIRIKHCMIKKIELISRPKFYFQIYTTLLDEWHYKHGQCNTRVNKYLYLGG